MASVTPEPWSSHPHPRWASWGRQSAGPQGVGAQAPMASHVSPGARPWGLRADGWASGRARRGRWVLSGLNVRAGWPGAPVGGWAPARHGDGDGQAQGRCVFEMGVLRVDEDTVMVMAEGRDRGQKEEKPRAVGCGGGGEGWRFRADGAARLGVVWGLGSRELKGPHRQAFPPAAGGGLDGSDGRGEGSATHATGQRSPKGPVSPACPPSQGCGGGGRPLPWAAARVSARAHPAPRRVGGTVSAWHWEAPASPAWMAGCWRPPGPWRPTIPDRTPRRAGIAVSAEGGAPRLVFRIPRGRSHFGPEDFPGPAGREAPRGRGGPRGSSWGAARLRPPGRCLQPPTGRAWL